MTKLYFDQPAGVWQEALVLGNGRIGAAVYGGVEREQLSLNEDTLWSGYPAATQKQMRAGALEQIRALARAGAYQEATELAQAALAESEDTQMYVPFGNLYIDFLQPRPGTEAHEVQDYRRCLDLETAEAEISYQSGNNRIIRTCLISQPQQLLIYHIQSTEPLQLRIWAGGGYLTSVCAQGEALHAFGRCPGRNPFFKGDVGTKRAVPVFPTEPEQMGMAYEGVGKVICPSGSIRADGDGLQIEDATEVTLCFAIRSSFAGFDCHPVLEGAEPSRRLQHDLAGMQLGYARLRENHRAEYQRYFQRVSLCLPQDVSPRRDVKQRLLFVAQGGEDRGLCALLFHYGRYLLIAASRPGTQAANLQGIWNQEMIAPWFSDYTININTQMNYWMTGVCHLWEMEEPLAVLCRQMLDDGKKTARAYFGCAGACAFHNVDLWRKTSPANGLAMWNFWPLGYAWLCNELFDHFRFTQDVEYLRSIVPVLEENVRFCLQIVVKTEAGLVVAPATSPENEFLDRGQKASVAYYSENANAIVRTLLRNYLQAVETLKSAGEECAKRYQPAAAVETLKSAGEERAERYQPAAAVEMLESAGEERAEWHQPAAAGEERTNGCGTLAQRAQAVLADMAPPRVGADETILEWNEALLEADVQHRHLSHLYELYPGSGIGADTPQLLEAARRSLQKRGDEGTGWSLAWKILLWARLRDKEQTGRMIRKMFSYIEANQPENLHRGGLYANLLCAHPPFQIDGNLGYTAGVAEALLQSHQGIIHILPSLPPTWDKGSFCGLRARGGIAVEASWEPGRTEARLKSGKEQWVTVQIEDGAKEQLFLPAETWVSVAADR